MADRSRTNPPPRLRVGFILARRFTLCAFANFVDVLRLAADEGDRSRPILCEWAVLSDTLNPIISSCGVAVQPHARLAEPDRFDYIVVVGGLMEEIPNLSAATVRFLKTAAEKLPLVGVCTGAFILHRIGLMNGYSCCVSWFHHADFLEQFEGLRPVSDQIFVIDRDRLTCSGGASSAHLAAHLVEKHVGLSQARKSLQIMIIDRVLGAEEPQPGLSPGKGVQDTVVRRALSHMQQTLVSPLAIEEIARRVEVGRRSLERRFATALNMSPSGAYLSLRLDQAEMLLRQGDQSVAAVATATGFCDSSHLAKIMKQRRGVAPAALRAARTKD